MKKKVANSEYFIFIAITRPKLFLILSLSTYVKNRVSPTVEVSLELANGKTLATGGDMTHRKPERRIVTHSIGGALDYVALVVPLDAVLVAVHGMFLHARKPPCKADEVDAPPHQICYSPVVK